MSDDTGMSEKVPRTSSLETGVSGVRGLPVVALELSSSFCVQLKHYSES